KGRLLGGTSPATTSVGERKKVRLSDSANITSAVATPSAASPLRTKIMRWRLRVTANSRGNACCHVRRRHGARAALHAMRCVLLQLRQRLLVGPQAAHRGDGDADHEPEGHDV